MDYDLFQSDDDEEILTAFTLATQKLQHETGKGQMDVDDAEEEESDEGLEFLPEFCCSGRDTLKSQFPGEGFLRNGYAHLPHPSVAALPIEYPGRGMAQFVYQGAT